MNVCMYLVGGCVRDELLGLKTKDIDFSVEIADLEGAPIDVGFAAMREHLEREGFHIFVETPEFLTIRAHFPKDHPEHGRTTADFVLCRQEGPYSDGRRPDWVKVGRLTHDLARRDFTVNAMARTEKSHILIDLHDGQRDLETMTLRCVGDPMERFREDALRVMRAMRFMVCKGFHFDGDLLYAMNTDEVIDALAEISVERREHELRLMFQHDTLRTMELLTGASPVRISYKLRYAAFDGLKLNPTTKRRLPQRG